MYTPRFLIGTTGTGTLRLLLTFFYKAWESRAKFLTAMLSSRGRNVFTCSAPRLFAAGAS